MKERLKISLPIIVEGRYDKIKVQSVADARIFTTDGFGIFNAVEKRALFLRLAEKSKIILLTDPDGAGRLIRSHLKGVLPAGRVINLYVPETEGKEKRKKSPSKSGLLGVEGTDPDKLREILAPYADGAEPLSGAGITRADFYADGLSGKQGSAALRAELARALGLPAEMSSGALLEAVNIICTADDYRREINRLTKKEV